MEYTYEPQPSTSSFISMDSNSTFVKLKEVYRRSNSNRGYLNPYPHYDYTQNNRRHLMRFVEIPFCDKYVLFVQIKIMKTISLIST